MQTLWLSLKSSTLHVCGVSLSVCIVRLWQWWGKIQSHDIHAWYPVKWDIILIACVMQIHIKILFELQTKIKKFQDCFLLSSSITNFLKLIHFTTAFSSTFWLIIKIYERYFCYIHVHILTWKKGCYNNTLEGKWVLTYVLLLSSHRQCAVMEKKKSIYTYFHNHLSPKLLYMG